MKKVGILMGSDSDLPVVQKGTAILKELEVPFEVHVYSAHRTPEQARKFCSEARENGFGVLICAAGMAAHLAGAAAAVSTLPVIGIPCKGPVLDGIDALLSTVQMPSGVPAGRSCFVVSAPLPVLITSFAVPTVTFGIRTAPLPNFSLSSL